MCEHAVLEVPVHIVVAVEEESRLAVLVIYKNHLV